MDKSEAWKFEKTVYIPTFISKPITLDQALADCASMANDFMYQPKDIFRYIEPTESKIDLINNAKREIQRGKELTEARKYYLKKKRDSIKRYNRVRENRKIIFESRVDYLKKNDKPNQLRIVKEQYYELAERSSSEHMRKQQQIEKTYKKNIRNIELWYLNEE
jgi:hypothetical protein